MIPIHTSGILLVEDSVPDATGIIRFFRDHNLSDYLIWAKDGAEALDCLFPIRAEIERKGAYVPNLILLDLWLPKVDGLEVLRRVRAERKTRSIPVVVLTSSEDDVDIVESFNLGVSNYMIKPPRPEEIYSMLSQFNILPPVLA